MDLSRGETMRNYSTEIGIAGDGKYGDRAFEVIREPISAVLCGSPCGRGVGLVVCRQPGEEDRRKEGPGQSRMQQLFQGYETPVLRER
jgi:hypothetical protein